jgi:hypothetical protein
MIHRNTVKTPNIDAAGGVLAGFVQTALSKRMESMRIARAFYSASFSKSGLADEETKGYFADQIEKMAYPKGGWGDPEETAWCTAALSRVPLHRSKTAELSIGWIDKCRNKNGGWGRHPRDQVRIPTTALVITLVPSVATAVDREWVRQAWEKDLNSPVHLSYKGGFYLLTVNNEDGEAIDPLVSRTIAFLADDQNNDGGFGPWRDHPIGSDPWSTGVVLWGLSKWIDYVSPVVIEKALAWLERTQLPSGYWPYHYLDEGTSYALIGAVAASRALANRK